MDIDVGAGVLTNLGNEAMRDYVVEYVTAAIDDYREWPYYLLILNLDTWYVRTYVRV